MHILSSRCHCHPVISCFIKIQIGGLTFSGAGLTRLSRKEAIKWVSVCGREALFAGLPWPVAVSVGNNTQLLSNCAVLHHCSMVLLAVIEGRVVLRHRWEQTLLFCVISGCCAACLYESWWVDLHKLQDAVTDAASAVINSRWFTRRSLRANLPIYVHLCCASRGVHTLLITAWLTRAYPGYVSALGRALMDVGTCNWQCAKLSPVSSTLVHNGHVSMNIWSSCHSSSRWLSGKLSDLANAAWS